MTLRELLSVIDNRIFVEVYDKDDLRIEEGYPNELLNVVDEKVLNVNVKEVSYDFESTDANTDLQISLDKGIALRGMELEKEYTLEELGL